MRFKEFEGEWEKCQIKDYGTIITGNTPSTADSENYQGEYLWASPADLDIGKFVIETQTKLSLKGFNKTRKLPFGTILVTCIGSTIGKMGMAQQEMSTNQQINSIISFPSNNKDYIYYAIKSRFPKYLALVSVQAVPILSKSSFEKLENYITTKDEQDKIGVFLSLIDERISTQIKIIEKFESLIKGIYNFLLGESSDYMKLGGLCEIKKGQQVNGTELTEFGEYYVMNGGIAPSGFYNFYNTNSNTISISEGGNSCGYVQYNDLPFWSGGHCYTLENVEGIINDRYLFHYLKANEASIMALRIGSGLPNIQKKDLSSFGVPLPTLTKQKEMANTLDKVVDKIGIEKGILAAYQKQKKFLLQSMFI